MLNQKQQILYQIEKSKNILITFNKQCNGDAIASGLALFLYLKKIGKNAEIAADQIPPSSPFSFLPCFKEIKSGLDNLRKFIISLDITNAKVGQIKYKVEENSLDFIISPKEGFFTHNDITTKSSGFKYDLIITIDTPDLESLGNIYDKDTEFFYQIPIINIDHSGENESYGQINFVELTATATAELLYGIFEKHNPELIDENIATCLLAGIISETRSYKTKNITPEALTISAKLISLGADRDKIVNTLYRSRSLNVLKLWGRVLARLSSAQENQLIWSSLSKSDFEKTSTSENDLEEVIDELIVNIPTAKIIVLISEAEQEGNPVTNALIYSVKNINSLAMVKKFNPVGMKNLAKIKLTKGIHEAEKEIIGAIQEEFAKISV